MGCILVKGSSKRQLELFMTEHCHLCEVAMDMLFNEPAMAGFQLSAVDIALQDELLNRYGEHIPVLRLEERELFWPFDEQMLLAWLRQES